MISACARGQEFWKVFVEKPMGFLGFYVKIITKPKVLEGFRLAREKKMSTLPYFLQGIIESWWCENQEMSVSIVFYKGKRVTTKNRIRISLTFLKLSQKNNENVAAA